MNHWKSLVTSGLACGVLLTAAAAVPQEDPERAPRAKGLSQLGDVQSVVEQALRHSADVRLAEAKVQQAELELTQARMAVVRQVVSLTSDLRELEERVAFGQQDLQQTMKLAQTGMVSHTEVRKAEAEMVALTGQIQRMKMELDFLTGKIDLGARDASRGPGAGPDPRAVESRPAPALHPVLARLQQTVNASFENVPVGELVNTLLQGSGVELVDEWGGLSSEMIYVENLSLSGTRQEWLTAVADLHQLVFVVRDYGLLLTTRDNARNYDSPTIPADFARRR